MNVGTLYELLDRLPEKCDDFMVRFTLRDRSDWIEPEYWEVDEGALYLKVFNDDEWDEFISIRRLKLILDGHFNDVCEEGEEVYPDLHVYVVDDDDESDSCWYYRVLDDRFEINWKRERVDVFIE